HIIKEMLGNEMTVSTDLPDRAVMTYTRQEKEKRNILHLLFAHTTVRGENTEVIEDTVPLYNVKCSIKTDSKPSNITLVPSGEKIDFNYSCGRAEFTVPKVDIHQMVSIED
ncbi:MAG: beta-galactosidase, partial [Clostridia bacterium]|nr:beta-galactosidase [Clostridia bacterium]